MGKKKGKDKKGKGAEKTIQKTDKKAEKKMKKELKQKGEADIEELIAEFQERDKKLAEISETKCPPPSPRCNMSLTAHPDRDELIMFGGEFYNGKQTLLYNDLYYYSMKNNEWSLVKSPDPPPPRCAHQAVAVSQAGGQLWVFGGEFASPTQSQFYHYRDLWCLHLRDKTWQKVSGGGGPSARSGHRMVACKKLLIIFGGFHDNIRDYKYFNDVHAFSLESYSWMKLEIAGIPPHPRSACSLLASQDQNHISIYGGYSKEKVKKDVDLGKTHTDMVILTVDSRCKQEAAPSKWKWVQSKQSGVRPSPRCGCTSIVVPGNRAVMFGGVYDEVEDEEEVEGVFYNDMYNLELDKSKWHEISLRGKRDPASRKKRRKKKVDNGEGDVKDGEKDPEEEEDDGYQEEEDEDYEEEMEDDLEDLKVTDEGQMEVLSSSDSTAAPSDSTAAPSDATAAPSDSTAAPSDSTAAPSDSTAAPSDSTAAPSDSTTAPSDSTTAPSDTGANDIFTVTVSSAPAQRENAPSQDNSVPEEIFLPHKRMNTLLAMKHGILYLYGGVFEIGDKQFTLSDMYSLDLHKLDVWNTIIACDLNLQEWEESDSSDEEEGEEDEEEMESDSEEEEEEDMEVAPPSVNEVETLDDYYERTSEHWLEAANQVAQDEGMKVSEKQLKKAASRMAKDHYKDQQDS